MREGFEPVDVRDGVVVEVQLREARELREAIDLLNAVLAETKFLLEGG